MYTKIRRVGPKINRRNLAVLFWLDYFPVVRSIPLPRRFFSSKIILNTEAKYSYMIEILIFIFGKIQLKLKIISYFPILQY